MGLGDAAGPPQEQVASPAAGEPAVDGGAAEGPPAGGSRQGRTPKELGFHMPAEWAPHKQTWMGWPTRPDNWRDGAKPAQAAFATVAAAIMEFEPVTVGIADEHKLDKVRAAQQNKQVEVVYIRQDDAWFRDTGPAFLLGPAAAQPPGGHQVAGVSWTFNAWGSKVKNYAEDNTISDRILFLEDVRPFRAPLVLEGGSIHVDGEGTLLTTEECLLNPNRNPSRSKAELEELLKAYTGVEKVLWLPQGLYADVDTDGHVDNFCCFARPGEVLLAWTDDEADEQHERSVEALRFLEAATDARGRRLKVTKLPVPPPLHMTEVEFEGLAEQKLFNSKRHAGDRLAASYVNFYMPNGGIVMPAFGGEAAEADERARRVLEGVFPERRVVAVPTRDILLGGGNIHCITQQQPSARPAEALPTLEAEAAPAGAPLGEREDPVTKPPEPLGEEEGGKKKGGVRMKNFEFTAV